MKFFAKETKKFTISFKVIFVSWLETCHRATVRQYVVNGQPLYYNLLLPSLSSSTFSHWYFSHNLFHQDCEGDEEEEEKFVTKDDAKSWKQRSLLQSVFNNFTSCFEYLHFSFNIVSKKFLRWYFLYYDENEYCHDKLSGLGFQIDRFIDNICQIIYLYFFYTYSITNRKAYSIEKPKRHKGLNKDLR